MSQVTSATLIARVQQGDQSSWRRLTDLYGPLVYFWCRQAGLKADAAADVVQEVFAAVARGVASFRGSGSFRGWLRTITRNKLNDHFRGLANREQAVGGTTVQQQMADVPEDVSDESLSQGEPDEIVALVHRGLDAVREHFEPHTWQAFWRVVVDGQDTSEVATDIGISANGVRQAKSRVLRRLREELGELDET